MFHPIIFPRGGNRTMYGFAGQSVMTWFNDTVGWFTMLGLNRWETDAF